MTARQHRIGWLGLVAGVWWASAAAPAADPDPRIAFELPLHQVPAAYRDAVRHAVEKPTLAVQGPPEVFRGQPRLYEWLLDHPDRGVLLWRGLGARCTEVTDLGGGRYGWTDGQGTRVRWECVARGAGYRVWYAEGSSHPAFLLPTIRARVVVVLRYGELTGARGRPLLQHQADLYLQIDSRTASLLTRLLGASAPRLAEQGLGQMEMFFSALVWYIDRHPVQAAPVLERLVPPAVRSPQS